MSVIAAYYSIAGLAAIFAAAVIPIVIMGSILEVGKVVVTLWLHEYWRQCRWLMKAYLVPAVLALMFITSMGIFGFLSKAHSDQSMVSGDVQARIAVYDEKIRTAKENIDANRRALKQMDEAVDQVMGRSTTEMGAERSVQIRRQQGPERQRLIREIEAEQKKISSLNEDRAPLAAEVRKVEAEVGPIKYIAALIYGDNPDANLLEAAVRWVIILLVVVFDPLAIMMLLAATESLKWERERVSELPKVDPTEQQFETALAKKRKVAQALDSGGDLPAEDTVIQESERDPHTAGWMFPTKHPPEPEKSIFEMHPYLLKGAGVPKDWGKVPPQVYKPPVETAVQTATSVSEPAMVESVDGEESAAMKLAMSRWKQDHPNDTLKHQRSLLERGIITQLPWLKYLDQEPQFGFGSSWPLNPNKGDTWIKTDHVPNQLYKFNGNQWIQVDKNQNDNYTYDMAYIDHLISKIKTGEYDPDMLSESEQAQVAQRLESQTNT